MSKTPPLPPCPVAIVDDDLGYDGDDVPSSRQYGESPPPPPPPSETPPPPPALSLSNGTIDESSHDLVGRVEDHDRVHRLAGVKLDLLTSISSSPPPQPLTPALTPPASRWHLGLIENYTIIDKVGSGTYGEVYKCQHKITKDIVALKKLRQDVEKNGFPVTSIREMKILKQLKHPNIVELKEIVSKPDLPKDGKKPPLYFAFEYMEHDLSGLLTHEKVPKFSRTQIQCYMRQLLYGIAFMHGQKIMHRDIKASNLLLNNAGMLKIADFGLSRFWTEANARSGRYTNKVVTLWYRPPELLMGCTAYDYSIDMWSVGCIFAELLLGKAPLQGRNELEQLQCIYGLVGVPTVDNWPLYEKLPNANVFTPDAKHVCLLAERFKEFPTTTVDLLSKMLTLDPSQRITALDALDHDYFWKIPTCKPKDLPKFPVASTHEYQSKKRHAAAPPSSQANPKRHPTTSTSSARTDAGGRGIGSTSSTSHAPPPPSHSLHPHHHHHYHGGSASSTSSTLRDSHHYGGGRPVPRYHEDSSRRQRQRRSQSRERPSQY